MTPLKNRLWTRRHVRRGRRKRRPRRPTLRFSPTAWAKLLFLRDRGPTEVGGFGITPAEDLLYLDDIRLIPQQGTETFVAFEDLAVAEFFEDQVDLGRRPDQFGRIWIHTHPGSCPRPSLLDRQTFERVFGQCDWAVLFILARGGASFAELYWRQGGPARLRLQVEVDFTRPFSGSEEAAWDAEYRATVQPNLTEPVFHWHNPSAKPTGNRPYGAFSRELPPLEECLPPF